MGKIKSLGFRHPNGECQVGSRTSALGVDERGIGWRYMFGSHQLIDGFRVMKLDYNGNECNMWKQEV